MSVYITKANLVKALSLLPDDTPLCPECKAELERVWGGEGKELYCPNEMCLNEERY